MSVTYIIADIENRAKHNPCGPLAFMLILGMRSGERIRCALVRNTGNFLEVDEHDSKGETRRTYVVKEAVETVTPQWL